MSRGIYIYVYMYIYIYIYIYIIYIISIYIQNASYKGLLGACRSHLPDLVAFEQAKWPAAGDKMLRILITRNSSHLSETITNWTKKLQLCSETRKFLEKCF